MILNLVLDYFRPSLFNNIICTYKSRDIIHCILKKRQRKHVQNVPIKDKNIRFSSLLSPLKDSHFSILKPVLTGSK